MPKSAPSSRPTSSAWSPYRAVLPACAAHGEATSSTSPRSAGLVGNAERLLRGLQACRGGLSEALAKEVAPLGIKVAGVEPGPFRTDWAGRSLKQTQSHIQAYDATAGAAAGRSPATAASSRATRCARPKPSSTSSNPEPARPSGAGRLGLGCGDEAAEGSARRNRGLARHSGGDRLPAVVMSLGVRAACLN